MAARGDIFKDDTALILSAAGAAAFEIAGPNCLELFPLSQRTAVIRTALDELRWQEDLRDWFEQDPSTAVFQLRHKRLVQKERYTQKMHDMTHLYPTTP